MMEFDAEIFHVVVTPSGQMQQYIKLQLFLFQLLRNCQFQVL